MLKTGHTESACSIHSNPDYPGPTEVYCFHWLLLAAYLLELLDLLLGELLLAQDGTVLLLSETEIIRRHNHPVAIHHLHITKVFSKSVNPHC